MKKNTVCLTILSALLLTGCSGASATISDKDEALFTVGDTTVTKGDEYELLKESNGGTMTLELAQRAVYDKVVPVTDDMKTSAQEQYDQLDESYTDLEDQIVAMGYEDKQDYIDTVLVPSEQGTALEKQYFTDNADKVKSTYKPSKVRILMCETEDLAKEALSKIDDGKSFDDIYDTYSSESSTYTNTDTVITTLTTDLPTRIIKKAYKAKEAGVIDEAITADDGTTYSYVVEVVENDYDKLIEEDDVRSAISSGDDFTDEMWTYYFTKYEFKVYDQTVFDYLKVNNPSYLIDYPELAESDDDSE